MSDVVIRVENLGKLYRIGERERYLALRDILTNAIYIPFRFLSNGARSHDQPDRLDGRDRQKRPIDETDESHCYIARPDPGPRTDWAKLIKTDSKRHRQR